MLASELFTACNYLTSADLWRSLLFVLTYGQRLKALREALDLSQETIAQRMGYKRQGNLSLYENDKKRPSVKTILRHAHAYGKKPSELLADVIVTEYDRIRSGAYDTNLQVGVSKSPTAPMAASGLARKHDGRRVASQPKAAHSTAPEKPHGDTGSLSGASHSADRRAVNDFERLTREAERAGRLDEPAPAARVVGEHAATSRAQTARRRPRARKSRR